MRKIEPKVRFWGMCDDRLRCATRWHPRSLAWCVVEIENTRWAGCDADGHE